MYEILIFLIIGLFAAMLFLNIYFRVKVLKAYKILVQNQIDFKAKHVFNSKKMKKEILPLYPQFENEILTFSSHIQYSIRMATVLMVLITLFGGVLMYYR
jgi:hypothetical protein